MRYRDGSDTGYIRRCLIAVLGAMLLALAAAVPVFAQEETTSEPTTGEGTTEEDGGTVQPQVVGGDPVPDGRFKFVAALRDVTRGNTVREQQFCGGTLIDRNSVLTAAHCLEGATPAPLRVTVGRAKLNSDQGQTRRVEAIFRHPRYTSSAISFRYDAAVLRLDRAVKDIRAIRIPSTRNNSFEVPGETATVAGWGNVRKQSPDFDEQDRFPQRMQEAQVPIVSDAEAERVYAEPEYDYRKPLMVAAGREGKDTCQGDSGGPMLVKDGDKFRQIGITSFGEGCGARGRPGVYAETNAEDIRSFIYTAADR